LEPTDKHLHLRPMQRMGQDQSRNQQSKNYESKEGKPTRAVHCLSPLAVRTVNDAEIRLFRLMFSLFLRNIC